MTDEQKEKCHKIADHYGENHQMMKAVEEMAELTQVIMKHFDSPHEWNNLASELADVSIMVEQLNYLISKNPYMVTMVDKYIDAKLYRQLKRMEEEKDA